jgi:hypothetical protein
MQTNVATSPKHDMARIVCKKNRAFRAVEVSEHLGKNHLKTVGFFPHTIQ